MKKLFKYLLLIIVISCLCFIFLNIKSNDIVVVSIKTYNNDILYKEGNGFVYKVDDYVYILTNYHVISDSDDVYIYYNNDKIMARVLNYDEYEDMAIIIVDKSIINHNMKISNGFKVNDKISVISGEDRINGMIDSKIIPIKFNYNNKSKMLDLIKVSADIKEGYSGSPVVDKDNSVVGIITMIDGNNNSYAIPIDMDKINLLESGNIYRANLGISASTSTDIKGVLLNEVFDNSKASGANLISGDIIVSIDDVSINDVSEFRYYLYKFKKNDNVKFKYYRSGSYYETSIILD